MSGITHGFVAKTLKLLWDCAFQKALMRFDKTVLQLAESTDQIVDESIQVTWKDVIDSWKSVRAHANSSSYFVPQDPNVSFDRVGSI